MRRSGSANLDHKNRLRHALAALAVLALALAALAPATAAAHEGDGVDAGFGHMRATADAAGVAAVELHISETDDCGKFKPAGLVAERGPLRVEGALREGGECVLSGEVALSEQGRWTVTAFLTYEGRPTSIAMPVGHAGQPGEFERTDWLHVTAAPSSGDAWWQPEGPLEYGAIGLLIGAALELARRRFLAEQTW